MFHWVFWLSTSLLNLIKNKNHCLFQRRHCFFQHSTNSTYLCLSARQVYVLWAQSAVSWLGWICSIRSSNRQKGWRALWAGPSTSHSSPSLCKWWQLLCSCGQPGVTARTTPAWLLTGWHRRDELIYQHPTGYNLSSYVMRGYELSINQPFSK